jgi:hypothetical protein
MPHAPSILATIVLKVVLAASGGLLARKLCLSCLNTVKRRPSVFGRNPVQEEPATTAPNPSSQVAHRADPSMRY